jgi:amino acid adenylation domain-containing protein
MMNNLNQPVDDSALDASTLDGRVGPTNTFVNFARHDIEQSIPDRFEQQVAKYPERIAVRTKSFTLTYAELDKAANRVAWAILDQEGQAQEPIALLFENGAPFVIASFGAMKAGKIQVPLESTFPQARLHYILQQSEARVVLTDNAHLSLARELSHLPVINTDERLGRFSTSTPGLDLPPDANVAIAYTSGSTGQPKGIVWNHRGVLHAVMRHTNTSHIDMNDRLIMFRASLRPSLCALLNGAAYYPVSLRVNDPAGLSDWLMQEQITVYRAAVSAFRSFAGALTRKETFPHLRLILLFGEAVYPTDVDLYKKHFADDSILGSSLGCSEFDDYAYFFVNKKTSLPIGGIPGGYPIADTEILILDERGRTVGIDQIGEIVIRSSYNAVGYWRRPDLTQAAFVPDPNGDNGTLYHTGDLGRRDSRGCLFHHGRKDFQVKIRGHRVEVSEVETALIEIEGVKEAVVAGMEITASDRRLVAYIVRQAGQLVNISGLRRHLIDKLPDFMVPSSFVFLDSLPLTATGKVDRRALPPPGRNRPAIDTPFVAPRTRAEETLAAIWAEVLDLENVGVNDAFLELGGDSLLAMQVISRVLARFRVALPLHDLFDAATVSEMALRLNRVANEFPDLQQFRKLLAELEAMTEQEALRRLGQIPR